MPIAVTFWPETPNRYSHTVEVVFELRSGEHLGFDLVFVGGPEPWVGWFTAKGQLVRQVAAGLA